MWGSLRLAPIIVDHLSTLQQEENRLNGLVGQLKTNKWAWFNQTWAWLLNYCAHFACMRNKTPLQEMLHPPLCQSATIFSTVMLYYYY
jgi:hypothetical protein